MATAALVALGFLCGSIPSGVLLARAAGVDPRRGGSGNIGATNVARTAGLRLGILTLVADAAKGFLPTVLARAILADPGGPALVAVAAFMGHLFPPALRFRGGKGVATALGTALALYPLATLPTVLAFAGVVAVTGWVSLGSMVAACLAPFLALAFGSPGPHVAAAFAMAALVVVRHRDNVVRMVRGHEPRVLLKRQALPRK